MRELQPKTPAGFLFILKLWCFGQKHIDKAIEEQKTNKYYNMDTLTGAVNNLEAEKSFQEY